MSKGSQRDVRMSLVVRADGDPIAGSLSGDGGCRSFVGWLELAAALEILLTAAANEDRAADDGHVRREGAEQ